MRSLLCAAALLISLHARAASADPPERAMFGVHATVGLDILDNGHLTSVATRGYAGIDVPLFGGSVQPTIGAGGTFGVGQLQVTDPRAIAGELSINYAEWGPEVRAGVRFVNGGIIDKQLFVSFSVLHTKLDERLMLDSVDGVGGTRGMRATVGFNYAEKMLEWSMPENGGKDSAMAILLLLAPQQVEVTWERSCGSDRAGISLGWGI